MARVHYESTAGGAELQVQVNLTADGEKYNEVEQFTFRTNSWHSDTTFNDK